MELYGMWSFVTGFFPLPWCFQGCSMYHYFVPYDGWITVHCVAVLHFDYLFTHQLINICVVSTFGLLGIILPRTFLSKLLCRYDFSCFGRRPRWVTARPCGNSMFSFLRNCQTVFQSGCIILRSYQYCVSLQSLHILNNICLLSFR